MKNFETRDAYSLSGTFFFVRRCRGLGKSQSWSGNVNFFFKWNWKRMNINEIMKLESRGKDPTSDQGELWSRLISWCQQCIVNCQASKSPLRLISFDWRLVSQNKRKARQRRRWGWRKWRLRRWQFSSSAAAMPGDHRNRRKLRNGFSIILLFCPPHWGIRIQIRQTPSHLNTFKPIRNETQEYQGLVVKDQWPSARPSHVRRPDLVV